MNMAPRLTGLAGFFLLLAWGHSVLGQSLDDERCNLCGCALNECIIGLGKAQIEFWLGETYYRQNCQWVNSQLNRPSSPYSISFCEEILQPRAVYECGCINKFTGEDVPIPPRNNDPTPAPDPFSGGNGGPGGPSNPASSPGGTPAPTPTNGGSLPCIPNSPGCDEFGRPTGGGSGATREFNMLGNYLVLIVSLATAAWTVLIA
mmetsp:Transcript_14805/g.40920  ORF Transcript_14805/g.40920 Transcript_14805/m.40920 type:complete len:204 (-) Transcript_14805:59-670(-)